VSCPAVGVGHSFCCSTALTHAVRFGYFEIVKYIIENGTNIHTEYDIALRTAAERGYLNIVKFLIENGADVHIGNDHPLKMAVSHNNIEMIKYLISVGSDVNSKNNYMIKWAATNGNLEILKIAIENNANVNSIDEQNKEIRIRKYRYINCLKFLLHNGYRLNLSEALYYVNKTNNAKLGKFLVNYGLDINLINNKSIKDKIKIELRYEKLNKITNE
jgi:ankyrin repeat protein